MGDKVKFIKTTSEKLENGEVQDTLQEDYAGAIIHTHDSNGDNQLYIGPERITDKLNVGEENLSDATLKINSLEASTIGALSRKTISEIILDMVRPVSVTSITLSKTTHQFEVNGTVTLTATVNPDDAVNKTVTWSTSDSSVATVSTSGKVTARKVGTATITAKAGGKTATCVVTVIPTVPTAATQPSASISYSGSKLISVGTNLPLESAISATINDGKWSGTQNANVPYAGGHSLELSITKDGTPVEFGSVGEEGIYTISGVATFTEGGIPTDNDIPPSEYPAYAGGTVNTNTITIKVVEPIKINGYDTNGSDDGDDVTVMRNYVLDYLSTTTHTLYITVPEEIDGTLDKFQVHLPGTFSTFTVKQFNELTQKYEIDVNMVLLEGEESKYIRTNDVFDTFGSAKYEIKLKK